MPNLVGAVSSAQCRSPHANQPLSRTCATAKYSCVTVAYSRKTRVVYKGAEVQEVALALRGRAGGQGQREAFVRGQAGSTSATVGSPAHTVPGRLAWRMRRTGGAGRRGPSPRFLCPHRHLVTPGTVPTSPCPPAWLAGPSILHRLGTSVRIPREWFPQQQPPHGRFQNFRLLLAVPQRAQGRRTSASY